MNEPYPAPNHRSTGLRARLARWIGGQPTTREMVEVIARMSAAIEDLARASSDERATLTGLQEQVDRLEKQEVRTGREQYKANLLSEAQQQSVKDTLERLKQTEAYRDRELTALRDQLTAAHIEGRLEIAQQLFPVIDGLDEALASGCRWLEQIEGRGTPAPRGPNSQVPLLGRLFGRPATRALPGPAPDNEVQGRLRSWLDGLELVRERLLDILAAQGITPIDTEDESFDPRWEVAVETTPPGTGQLPGQILKTQRRGFRREDTVLRYAEVVVAREAMEASQPGSDPP